MRTFRSSTSPRPVAPFIASRGSARTVARVVLLASSVAAGVAAGVAAAAGLAGCASSDGAGAECTASSLDALRVCAAGPTVKGVDVSTYQGQVDWAAAKKDGVAFAFARVSDGLTHPDAQFTRNWQVLKTDGIIRGAYQFFRPALDPIAQADLLLQKLKDAGGLLPGDLPPVLDAETVDGVSNATLRANMLAWLTHVETATGRRPIVYTAQFMSANVGTGFASYPLWVANYGVTCPSMPDGWSAWKFWQSSSTGAVAGITGDVDVNAFNGTLADLVKLAGSASSPDAGTDAGNARDGGSVIADAGAAPLDAAGSGPPRGDSGATLGGGAPPATTGDAGRTASGDPCATSAAGR